VLVYDGDCAFCTRSIRLVRRLHADVDVVAAQCADLPGLGLSQDQADESLRWVEPDGRIRSGHQAVGALLAHSRWPFPLLGRLMRQPPLAALAAAAYRWVAANRRRLPGGTPACALPPERRPGASG
jgi:predicted DCC family thiol-disulfide oxidoreductase YuxK